MGGATVTAKGHQALLASIHGLEPRLIANQRDRLLILGEIDKLLAAFPMQDRGSNAAALVDAYRSALGDAPAWAVCQARMRVIRGEVSGLSQAFAPSPPQFAGIVREILRPLQEDLADLEALAQIEAEREPEASRRIAAGFDELKAELRRPVDRKAQYDADWAALERRAMNNGHDPKTAMEATPDQNKTSGIIKSARITNADVP